jgi:hypothetical protein
MLKKLRNQFEEEWIWRTFIVFQIAGIIGIIYLDISDINWDFLPNFSQYGNYWHLFDSFHYTRYKTNWYTLSLLFGPFAISKAIDWITRAKEKSV